jgi:hypothetical protein
VDASSGAGAPASAVGCCGDPIPPSTVGCGDDPIPPSAVTTAPLSPPLAEAEGRAAIVAESATKPSLKCVTWPEATPPSTVVGTVSNPVPSLVDHTMIGCATLPLNESFTVTGDANTRPAGPNW